MDTFPGKIQLLTNCDRHIRICTAGLKPESIARVPVLLTGEISSFSTSPAGTAARSTSVIRPQVETGVVDIPMMKYEFDRSNGKRPA